jgi:hypothetical protein
VVEGLNSIMDEYDMGARKVRKGLTVVQLAANVLDGVRNLGWQLEGSNG